MDKPGEIPSGGYFLHKTIVIPHDDKKHKGGEDAVHASDNLMIIADGVGGWVRWGVDSGLYSKDLVKGIYQ